ncbi:MAG: hypothetical protein AAFX56_07765 [Pseudomonadota bacterium]
MSYSSPRSNRTPAAGFLLTAAFLLSACGGKSADSDALGKDDGILSYIPADTPYVMANAEPIDEALLEKMSSEASVMIKSYQRVIDDIIAEDLDELPANSPEREELRRGGEIMKQALALLTPDGMREAGLDMNESSALYGHGILPVLRIRLLDAERFEETIAEFEDALDYELESAELAGYRYRHLPAEELRIVLGAFGDYVVLTVAPQSYGDAELTPLVGIEKPARNIAASGVLEELADEYELSNHFLGFFDTEQFAKSIMDGQQGVDEVFFKDSGFDRGDLSDVCREEIMQVAGVMPRMAFGYRQISLDGVDSTFVLELREDIAAGLQRLPASVPGLGTDFGGLMSFGFSVQPKELMDFYTARLDSLEADPYECDLLGDLQASLEGGRAMLAQPIPPKLNDFRGLVAIVDELDVESLMAGVPPMDTDATIVIAVEDAPALVQMGAAFSPELAAMGLEPNGKAMPLEVPQAQMLPAVPYVALTDNLLAVSTGQAAESRISRAIAADGSDASTFMSMAVDAATYYGIMTQSAAMENAAGGADDARMAMLDAMQALADVYDRMNFQVRFTERGVEVDSELTFKE